MTAIRRLSWAALTVACLHLVFGAIVRITGSGMGCGDNWPKCYGHWFPPLDRPDLIVEVSHRYLASILVIAVCSLAFVAWRRRAEPGVAGPGGPMRSAFGAVAAVFAAAILGGVTVKLGNAPSATVAHWIVAMTLLGLVATTAIRAGALGGGTARTQHGTTATARAAFAAAGLAFLAVAMGGLTANYPGAPIGCLRFPLCGANPAVAWGATVVQVAHRGVAFGLILYLGIMVLVTTARRADEAPIVVRAARIAFGLSLLQVLIAGAMIGLHLPATLRSLHEAAGVAIWLGCFAFAYLARRATPRRDRAATSAPELAIPAPRVTQSRASVR
ncbi:MAG TPA: COX15/CtaA family protein [Gemmatimonadaceae bacterium]|nr:COX15/CtaA family protein [Gemmatimonadaceae bacterium]